MGSRTEIYLFSIIILQALAIPIFAEENIDDSKSVMLETDKPEYHVGEMMIISCFVEEKKMPVVAIRIFDPNGGILSAHQLELEANNTFSKTILLDSPFYDDEGDYTISVHYGKLQAETNFKMVSAGQDESLVEDDSLTLLPEIIVMFTDKEVYQDGDTVTIYGLVSEKDEESVLVGIYDPFDTPAGFYFGNVDSNLEFKVSFLVKAGVNFKTEGTYSVSAFYGDSEEVVNFEFVKQNKNQTPIEEKKTSDDIKSSEPNEKITEDKNDEPALSNNNIKNPPINPTNYFTLNNKANVLANLGNFQEAFSLYKKALAVGGDNPIVLQNLEKALDKSITLQMKNEPIILKNDTQPQDSIMESEKNLIKTSNQQTENIFEQLGSILSSIGNSIFSFLS